MLLNTASCRLAGATHKQIEQGFTIACFTWEKVKDHISAGIFQSKSDEIIFFKKIKPCFTGYIEFYTMLYTSLMFKPATREEADIYWRHEWTKLERYKKAYAQIVRYLEKGCNRYDEEYFTSANNDFHHTKYAKVYDVDSVFCAKFDYIATGLIAHKLLHEHIVHNVG